MLRLKTVPRSWVPPAEVVPYNLPSLPCTSGPAGELPLVELNDQSGVKRPLVLRLNTVPTPLLPPVDAVP